jgi:pimeloyl-ACP methyl ester carboxylesterase
MTDDGWRTIKTPDGRALEVFAGPPSGGWTLLWQPGTPSGPVAYPPLLAAAAERGIRVVQYARPGYARSDRKPGRTVADAAADIVAVLDVLGVDRCVTVGWSGGGPHALAAAALAPDRVAAAATLAGVAPFDAEGLDFLAGMGQDNVDEFGAAVAGPDELRAYLEQAARPFVTVTPEEVAAAFGDVVSDVDRASLTGGFAENMAAGLRAALSTGIWGWHDDDMAFVRPWGFDLASIRVPVTVWQGDQDRMVPGAHGRWLAAHLPGVRARLEPAEGHLSLAVAALDRILDDLEDQAVSGVG